jgi:hypothetical protein
VGTTVEATFAEDYSVVPRYDTKPRTRHLAIAVNVSIANRNRGGLKSREHYIISLMG